MDSFIKFRLDPMRKTIMIISWLLYIFPAKAQKTIYDSYPVYKGNDLGLTYSPKESVFKIWAPTAEKAQLIFYDNGDGGEKIGLYAMNKDVNGTWWVNVKGDQFGFFY